MTLRPPPSDLIDAIKRKKCAVFVGAGLSQQSGFPSWKDLLEHMIGYVKAQQIIWDDDTESQINEYWNQKEYLKLARLVKTHLPPELFQRFLTAEFTNREYRFTPTHSLLPELGFVTILTTNYDNLLESAYDHSLGFMPLSFTQVDDEPIRTSLSSDKAYIFHLHGKIDRPGTIILTEDDYNLLTNQNLAYKFHLQNTFATQTVLFIGYGLNDPDLMLVLDDLKDVLKSPAGFHYAFMASGYISKEQEKFYQDNYNIRILLYEAKTPEHQEVNEFLQMLLEQKNSSDQMAELLPEMSEISPSQSNFDLNDSISEQDKKANEEAVELTSDESQPIPLPIRKLIGKIHPELNPGLAIYIEEHVHENLELANALVLGLKNNPDAQGMSELVRTKEVKTQLETSIPGEYTVRRTLQALSLLPRVGVEEEVEKEGRILADFLDLNFEEFLRTTENLCEQGTVTRQGRYRYITNHFMAVLFASQVWHGKGKKLQEIVLNASISKEMRENFLKRLADLGDLEVARPLVQAILFVSFKNIDDLDTRENSAFFYVLAQGDPESAANVLENVLSSVSHERLLEFSNGRRNVIYVLEMLLLLKKTFWIAARLLLKLAAAENENWGNNATGIWKDIFLLRIGQAPISPIERYSLIKEALHASQIVEVRLLGVAAISETLSIYESRSIARGPGGYVIDPHWIIKTWGEFWAARLYALQLLDIALNDDDTSVVLQARAWLMQSARAQMFVLSDEILDRLEMLPVTENDKKVLWDLLQNILKSQGKDLTGKQYERITSWANSLIKEDVYHDQLLRWVVSVSISEFSEDRNERRQKITKKVEELADESFQNAQLLRSELPWLASQPTQYFSNLFVFGQRLGVLDHHREFFDEITTQVRETKITDILIAYLRGRLQAGDEAWISDWLDRWTDEDRLMTQVVLELTRYLHDTAHEGTIRLVKLMEKGWARPADFSWWSDWIQELDLSDLQSLLDLINGLESPDKIFASASLLDNWLEDEAHQEFKPLLASYALQFLSSPVGDWEQVWQYWDHWQNLALSYLATNTTEVVQAVLNNFAQVSGFYAGPEDQRIEVLKEALRIDPSLTWEEIGKRVLLDPDNPEYIWIEKLALLNIEAYVPAAILLEWAENNQPKGPRELATIARADRPNLPFLARELIIRYSHDEEITGYVYGNFGMVTSWEGKYSDQIKRELDIAENWLKDEHPAIKAWAEKIVQSLRAQWEQAKKRDDEDQY